MTRNATTGVGRWRQGGASRPTAPAGPTGASKWTGAAALSVVLLAVVDHDGKIQILATDSKPYEPGTHLPLSWILDRLKKCPVKNKLLVLDIMRGMVDPRDIGGTADGVGDLVRKELQSESDSDQLN